MIAATRTPDSSAASDIQGAWQPPLRSTVFGTIPKGSAAESNRILPLLELLYAGQPSVWGPKHPPGYVIVDLRKKLRCSLREAARQFGGIDPTDVNELILDSNKLPTLEGLPIDELDSVRMSSLLRFLDPVARTHLTTPLMRVRGCPIS